MKAQTGPKDAWKSSSHKISQGLKTWTSSKQVAKALYGHLCALHVQPGDKELRKLIPEEFLPEHKEGLVTLIQELPHCQGPSQSLSPGSHHGGGPEWWLFCKLLFLHGSFFSDLPVPVPPCTLGTSGSSQSGVISCPRGHLATPGDIFWSGGCHWHQ